MCFTEYLAYTCGHTSVAVNRPCPMTTNLHNNPCCPNPACRPFLVETVCHPCARILHSRGVNIAEYEHRFMHERGACQCEVQFPALLHPRLIHRPSTDSSAAASSAVSGSVQSENYADTASSGTLSYGPGSNDSSSYYQHHNNQNRPQSQHSQLSQQNQYTQSNQHGHQQNHGTTDFGPNANGAGKSGGNGKKGKGKWKAKNRRGSGNSNRNGSGNYNFNNGNVNASQTQPQQYYNHGADAAHADPMHQNHMTGREEGAAELPLFEERRVGDDVAVAVRLSSMYAAEWTKDHAKLHHSGRCKCPVKFEPYKPLNTGPIESYPNSPTEIQTASDDVSPKTMAVAPVHGVQQQNWRVRPGTAPAQPVIAHSSAAAGTFPYAQKINHNQYAQQTGQHNTHGNGYGTPPATVHHGGNQGVSAYYNNQAPYNNNNHHHNYPQLPQEKVRIPPVRPVVREPFTHAMMSPLDELLGVAGPGLMPAPKITSASASTNTNINGKENFAVADNHEEQASGVISVGAGAGTGAGKPFDVQTVHYSLSEDNVPISGNPLNVSVSVSGNAGPVEGTENEMQLPTIVEYPQPEEVIAGFPLGAGPEGQQQSHAADFEHCALNLRLRKSFKQQQQRRFSNEF